MLLPFKWRNLLILLSYVVFVLIEAGDPFVGHTLPLLPPNLPSVTIFNQTIGKYIPQKLWVAVKDKSDPLPGHWSELLTRNSHWQVNICDNDCKDNFMKTVFGNTIIYWAYTKINPLVGAAKADIWRYSVLYTYGGVYLDDDSDMKTPFDEVGINKQLSVIVFYFPCFKKN
jgi:mannosyltransferase OCH1-like enzyme